jgi:PAS domain S-box-containing protein
MCYLWNPQLLLAHVVADALIATAYFSIPAFLIWLVRKRHDLPFSWIFVLFALFIVGCGTTHLMSIWVIWHPDYWLEAGIKWVTAAASIATAFALVPLAPKVLSLQSRAQAIEALHESENRNRMFLQSLPQMVWTADAQGSIDWYNDRWYDYTGQTPQEALGWGWRAVHHPDDIAKVMERWPHSIATGQPFEMEFRLRGKDGIFRWFLTRGLPQRRDGAVVRWYGSCTNVDAQRRELERSSQIARTLQEAFLADALPQNEHVRFDSLYRSAESDALVGGDWYDAFALADGRILISCGDVAGHGIDAAMLAVRFRQGIALLGIEHPDPADIVARLNRAAIARDDGIATAVVALYDTVENSLTYAIAGHPPPVLAFRSGERRFLETGGLPLGVTIDATWTSRTVALAPAATVVFYTDGITESARDVLGGEQKLLEAAKRISGKDYGPHPASAINDYVFAGSSPADDVAILVLQGGERAYAPSQSAGGAVA